MTLEMKGIYKSFGANDVLRDVSFTLNGGEICALLGENGAGKSTLMNILGGVHHADQGQILLDGKRVAFQTPADSLKHGIAFIHQELNLVNDLAIYENMFIGHELRKKNRFLDSAAMIAKTNEVFKKMDLDLDPRIMVRDLDASYKQIVEIARALLMEASIIIMDEPTTSLTEPEIRRVFDMMNTLRKSGVGIVFISHKLREVMEICTRYTVLRDGNMVSSGLVSETSVDMLARDMVGHDVRTQSLRREKKIGDVILSGKGMTLEPHFRNVSFEVHAGEVLGFTGLLGDGRSELFQAVFGAIHGASGTVEVEGKPVHIRTTGQALKAGVGYVMSLEAVQIVFAKAQVDAQFTDGGSVIAKVLHALFLVAQGHMSAQFHKLLDEGLVADACADKGDFFALNKLGKLLLIFLHKNSSSSIGSWYNTAPHGQRGDHFTVPL